MSDEDLACVQNMPGKYFAIGTTLLDEDLIKVPNVFLNDIAKVLNSCDQDFGNDK